MSKEFTRRVLEIAKLERDADALRQRQPHTAAWKMKRAQRLRDTSSSYGPDGYHSIAQTSKVRREY